MAHIIILKGLSDTLVDVNETCTQYDERNSITAYNITVATAQQDLLDAMTGAQRDIDDKHAALTALM